MKVKVFFILCCLILLNSFVPIVSAQEASLTAKTKPVDYTLPYPGMLPGSPLYFLKTFRNNLMRFFISDPLKKAEFELLESDKSFAASVALFDHGETDLAVASLKEALQTFELAIKRTGEAGKEGIFISDFAIRLMVANQKHEEVVLQLTKTEKGRKHQQVLNQTFEKLQQLEKKVTRLLPQK